MDARTLVDRPASRAALIVLWSGLLALPFTGVRGALAVAGVVAVAAAARLAGKAPAVRGAAKALTSSVSSSPVIAGIRRGASSRPFRAVAVLAGAVLPLFLNDYYRDVLTLTGMYAVLALGLNIVVGQTGLLNLGYVAFYAVGAYTYAILSTRLGLPFWPGVAAGAASAAAGALVLGSITLRLRGDYFAIVTLGLGEITRIVLNNWDSMTGGPNGIANIGRPRLGGIVLSSPIEFYYLILAALLFVLAGLGRLIRSRIGRAWIAIREDEVAAEAMGVDTFRLKLLAFVIGSAVAGAVGTFFAAKMAFVSPESFTFMESVLILCMVVLGGMRSLAGTVLGAVLLVTLPEMFREFQDFRMLAFGLALVVMMIFRPQGIISPARGVR